MITKRKAITLIPASLATASSFSKFGVAQTQKEPPAEIMTLIDTVFNAFNTKDCALLYSAYVGNLVVIDGFAPYRWVGPDAVAEWWTDAEAWAKEGGVEKEHLAYDGIRAWGLVGAYASKAATLTITLKKGDSIHPTGYPYLHVRKAGQGMEG
jgi:ketosteroid isomerase-like protein